MKLPNRHRLATLTALTVLLAGVSTGCLSLCEIFLGVEPEEGPDENHTVTAGQTVNDFTSLGGIFSRFIICDYSLANSRSGLIPAGAITEVPAGCYARTNRDFTGKEPIASVDLVTANSTPPGTYVLEYRDASPGSYVVGTLNLTILPGELPDVVACMAVYPDKGAEVIIVNQNANFYGCCSTSPKGDPIVQYKWWWDYNGNPSSSPNATTEFCITDHVYTTPGPKTTRLVVRTESGEEAAETYEILVQGL